MSSIIFNSSRDNVWQLGEVADFEMLHCQLSTNFNRSTKLSYEAPNRQFFVGAVSG